MLLEDVLGKAIDDAEYGRLVKRYFKALRVLETFDVGAYEWWIYPYGKFGRIVEKILVELNKDVKIRIFDDVLCESISNIYPLDSIGSIDTENTRFVICSDRREIYTEIRKRVFRFIPFDIVIDAFSPSMFYDASGYYDGLFCRRNDLVFPRVTALEYASREIYANNVPGEVAEVGVYRGDFARYIGRFFPDRKLFLFDTFYGFDNRDIDDIEDEYSLSFRRIRNHTDSSPKIALSKIDCEEHTVVKQGYFPDTTVNVEKERFAFVSLDTDLYKPIRAGLEFFWPRLSTGGYIFVDDFGHEMLMGVRAAVIEFCKKNHVGYSVVDDGIDRTAIIQKPL